MKFSPSQLTLKNKTVFTGFSPTWQKNISSGEVVFTTGMTGYVESLTDPSYAGQILTFTYPLIGNYGVPDKKYWESKKIHAHGVIVGEACLNWSHQAGKTGLLDWLKEQNIPIITDVDTRALTKLLREHGVMLGAINCSQNKLKKDYKFIDPNKNNLIAKVSINKKKTYGKSNKKIFVIDCGMKENIMRSLLKFDLNIERIPYNYDFTNKKFAGVFISNGPGDPLTAKETVKIIQKAMKAKKPIFGICLGAQIIALAAGAKTYKLPYGHRGQNQPCIETTSKHCYITSQNHGYAINEKTLPKNWEVTFRNLNDNSVEGITHKSLPFFAVQFHPEATPGPTDTEWLFKKFYDSI